MAICGFPLKQTKIAKTSLHEFFYFQLFEFCLQVKVILILVLKKL